MSTLPSGHRDYLRIRATQVRNEESEAKESLSLCVTRWILPLRVSNHTTRSRTPKPLQCALDPDYVNPWRGIVHKMRRLWQRMFKRCYWMLNWSLLLTVWETDGKLAYASWIVLIVDLIEKKAFWCLRISCSQSSRAKWPQRVVPAQMDRVQKLDWKKLWRKR